MGEDGNNIPLLAAGGAALGAGFAIGTLCNAPRVIKLV